MATPQEQFELGVQASESNQHDLAIEHFEHALALDPRHARAHEALGWALYGVSKDLAAAHEHLQAAIEIDPTLGWAQLYLGVVLHRLRRLDESEAHFRESLRLLPGSAIPEATYAEELLWHNSRYGEAEVHFKKALVIDPTCSLALRDYARMLARHGRDDEARALLHKAMEVDPDCRFNRRAFEEVTDEITEAGRDSTECLREAVARDPNYVEGMARLRDHTR